MWYALIHNNQIEVGPRAWLWSAFKEYLDDAELDSSALERKAPTEPIITSEWKLLPVHIEDQPFHTYPFEQLAGPFLTINENDVTGTWGIAPIENIGIAQGHFKDIVTKNRYLVETAGIKVTVQGKEVTIDTSRDGRQIYLDTFLAMSDTETINWKFNEGWVAVTKDDMSAIVLAGKEHIQNCFNWEKEKWEAIDACTTRAEFEAIELRHPSQIILEVIV